MGCSERVVWPSTWPWNGFIKHSAISGNVRSVIGVESVSLCVVERRPKMFRTLTRRLSEWSRIHRDVQRLKQLDDHLLADLGIERECITHSALRGEK